MVANGELYQHVNEEQIFLEMKIGLKVSYETGELESVQNNLMATEHFYKAELGSILHLQLEEYSFAVVTYSLERDMKYLYTYDYQKEENWTTYNHNLTQEIYGQTDYLFDQELYFRVNLKRLDGMNITVEETRNVNQILQYRSKKAVYIEKEYFREEINVTAKSIRNKRNEDSMVFALLTDTHYVVNGTWEDTSYNLKELHKEIGFDGVIHLGDMTDGMVSAKVTKDYVTREMEDLKALDIPIYQVLGNHDSNYFNSNPERMSRQEQQDFYFSFIDQDIKRNQGNSYYYVDFDGIKLRGIFLESYDFEEEIKYGFSNEALAWLGETLKVTPEGYSVVIFSHVPPLGCIHYWTDQIRNSDLLMELLEEYDAIDGKCVMAYIHGHNHADQIYRERRFPIISIGCTKFEYFTDKKPEGSFTEPRTLNMVTQELWDIMIINPTEKKLELIRFGAGSDRTIILGH